MVRDHSGMVRTAGFLLALLVSFPALGGDEVWTGDAPFPSGAGSRTVNAFAVDPASGTLYAGTSSGTVFTYSDSSLSQPPQAVDDEAVTDVDTPISIEVLLNDFDPEDALDAGSVAIAASPTNGNVTVDLDGSVTYTPDDSFTGTDNFTYTVLDAAGAESNAANVAVAVQDDSGNGGDDGNGGGGNTAPIANNDYVMVRSGESIIIPVLGNDAEPDDQDELDAASVRIENGPARGNAEPLASGAIRYTPADGFTGSDDFAYSVADSRGARSNMARVAVSVLAPSSPPTGSGNNGGGAVGIGLTVVLLMLVMRRLRGSRRGIAVRGRC